MLVQNTKLAVVKAPQVFPAINHYPDKMPKVAFKVLDKDDVYNYNSSFNKVLRITILIFSILIPPIGFLRLIGKSINFIATQKFILPSIKLPKASLDKERNKHLVDVNFAKKCERIVIQTADHIKLDTFMVHHPIEKNKAIQEQKYIIYFNGNANTYETSLPTLRKISEETGVNVYSGNYRGVGHSEGFPADVRDLAMDGEALLNYLLSQGVSQKNILIHGKFLGGAVGAYVAAMHQEEGKEINYCGERTFALMKEHVKAISHRYRQKLRKVNKFTGKIHSTFLSILNSLAARLICALGWNFKTLESYKSIKGHKFIIYHRRDPIIPYAASLYKRYKDSEMSLNERRIKLERMVQKIKWGNKYVRDPKLKAYRPKNAIRLDYKIQKLKGHEISIHESSQFNDYKAQVVLAFSAS